MATFNFDVVIAGASFGGVAAALAAAADPRVKVVLLESSQWVGGQATSQGATRWGEAPFHLTETTGSPKSYRDLRQLIRAEYSGERSAVGLQQEYFNPGVAEVGPPFEMPGRPFAADPQVVRRVLTQQLQDAGVEVKLGVTVTAMDIQAAAVKSVTAGGDTYVGRVYLDATDLGDLLPMSGVKWVIGSEARSDTGESEAEDVAHPEWVQPFTVPIAVEWRPEAEDHRIPKPANYEDIRYRQGFDRLKKPGPGGGEGSIRAVHNPSQRGNTLFNHGVFVDPRNFNDGRALRTTLNVGSNDYLASAIPVNPPSASDDAQIVEQGRAVSIAYVYYLQHDVPRDDGNGAGYPNIMVDTTAFGTADGTAPAPYIRESRRLANPRVRVVEQDIDAQTFDGPRARNFPDSCGIGWYFISVHEGWYSANGNPADAVTPNIGTPFHFIRTAPFQVSLGSLLPAELDNFVVACKNIGATHLTSGAYRVHSIEWAIGDAAGVLAAYCSTQKVAPGAVWGDTSRVTAYQSRLLARGTPIFWWDDVKFEDGIQAFTAIHLLGVRGTFDGDGETRNFEPGGDFPESSREAMNEKLNHAFDWPRGSITRAQAAVLICEQLENRRAAAPLRALDIAGWRQFEKIHLDFDDRLTIITGANGAGKTTILNILAGHFGWRVPLATSPLAPFPAQVAQYVTSFWGRIQDLIRRGAGKRARIVIGTIVYDEGRAEILVPETTSDQSYTIEYSALSTIRGLYIPSHRPVYAPTHQMVDLGPVSVAEAFRSYSTAVRSAWIPGVRSGYTPLQILKSTLLSWMTHGQSLVRFKECFVDKLRIVLPDSLEFKHLTTHGLEIVLETGTGEFTLDAVSGGVAALIDLTWQIFTYSASGAGRFVVLIDEPENHLHPKLQRSVLHNLTKAFPDGQFIVSSHAPLVVTSVEHAKVYALTYRPMESVPRPSDQTSGFESGPIPSNQRVVRAELLDAFDRAGSANDVLREVLGLEYAMPVWAANIVEAAVRQVASKGYTASALTQLDRTLSKNSLDRYAPQVLTTLRKRAEEDAGSVGLASQGDVPQRDRSLNTDDSELPP